MIALLLSLAMASEICVKQAPSKDPVCLFQDDKDLVVEGKNCTSLWVDNVKMELGWWQMEVGKYQGYWRCSWCWKCEDK